MSAFTLDDIPSFFDFFPEADVIPEFKALRNKRDDTIASHLLWYIRFLHDPEHEYVHRLPKANREELLKGYFKIKKTDLSSALFKAAEAWYSEHYMSRVKRSLALLHRKAEEAEKVLREGEMYSPEDIKKFTDALKALKEFRQELEIAEREFKSGIAKRAVKAFGKDQQINGAEDGSLWE